MENIEFKKVKAPIIGADGNIFNLIGICQRELKKAGYLSESKEMAQRVMNSSSYEEALNILQEYVIPTNINNYNTEM